MPRRSASGSGTIRQRKDGIWEARYTTGRDPGTGKQVQKSVYGKSQRDVRQKLTAATAAIDDGLYVEPSKLTLGAWLDIWLKDYVERSVKPATHESYTMLSNNKIKPALAAVRLSSLNAHTIQRFYNNLSKTTTVKSGSSTKEKPGLSAKSIKNIHGVLHSALQQAVTLGYIKHNPSNACVLPRIPKKVIVPLNENDSALFLSAISGHRFETLFLVTLFTGMRRGELLGLKWNCVDFNNGTILIDKQLLKEKKKGSQYYLSSVKNDKVRRITPAQTVLEALKLYRIKQNEWKTIAGPAWEDNDFVFSNELGQHLTHVTVSKTFKRIISDVGITTARFHDLRHTYAVMSLQSGDDVKTVQENLGHHSAAFTLDVYGHVTEKMKNESAARMDGVIKGILSLKG